MCYILLSACSTCNRTLQLGYARCGHAAMHSFDPAACPNRMKRRRCSEGTVCEKCESRRGSLSMPPTTNLLESRGESIVEEDEKERRRKRLVMRRRQKAKST
jgi:hypothetical protein